MFKAIMESIAQNFSTQSIQDKYKEDYLSIEFLASLPDALVGYLNNSCSSEEHNLSRADETFYILLGISKITTFMYLKENNYLDTLIRKKKQLIYVDDYGDEVTDDWDREIKKFTNKRFYALVDYYKSNIDQFYWDRDERDVLDIDLDIDFDIDLILSYYEIEKEFEQEEGEGFTSDDPYEYEEFIAESLRNLGWDATATSGSGDQGADVIARKEGYTLVVQCKLYSQPVGNKAVQEVHAAKGYYEADIAIVVTNASYTKSARQLSDSLDIYLLHDEELSMFDDAIFTE
jgi:hypothetical protein